MPEFVFAVTNDQLKSMVQIICPTSLGYSVGGTGTIIRGDGIILTNKHVVEDASGVCSIGITSSSLEKPSFLYTADILSVADKFDIAILVIKEKKSGFPYIDFYNSYSASRRNPSLGEEIEILGYPGIGGTTITFTKGYVLGQENIQSDYNDTSYWYTKTDALIAHGNSGGAAFYKDGVFAGIPTSVRKDDITAIGYITPAVLVWDFIKFNYQGINGIPNGSSSYIPAPVISQTDTNFNVGGYFNIYTDGSKFALMDRYTYTGAGVLVNSFTDSTPHFEWGIGYHASGIMGYYVYFGKNKNADPVTAGVFIQNPEYSPEKITENGDYYFIIAYKAKNGVIADKKQIENYKYEITAEYKSKTNSIKDGSLIKGIGQNDIYIVKIIGNKKFKRLVLSPAVFNSYGHLRWGDVIEVTQDTIEAYITSNLVRATVAGDPQVFLLYPEAISLDGKSKGDNGLKRWVKNEAAFNSLKLDWDAIYTINEVDRDSYDIEGTLAAPQSYFGEFYYDGNTRTFQKVNGNLPGSKTLYYWFDIIESYMPVDCSSFASECKTSILPDGEKYTYFTAGLSGFMIAKINGKENYVRSTIKELSPTGRTNACIQQMELPNMKITISNNSYSDSSGVTSCNDTSAFYHVSAPPGIYDISINIPTGWKFAIQPPATIDLKKGENTLWIYITK